MLNIKTSSHLLWITMKFYYLCNVFVIKFYIAKNYETTNDNNTVFK